MWDLKPGAPEGIRGEFKPMDTAAKGVQISEHMPETAKQQEGSPEIEPETHPGEHAETERAQGEKPEVEGREVKEP